MNLQGRCVFAARKSLVVATALHATFLLLFLPACNFAWQKNSDYSRQIANADLSQFWVSQQLLLIEDSKEQFVPRPELLGFIGEDYQRVYIHFITATRNASDHMQYLVTGKTKVHSNINDFKGTITIKEACLDPDPEYPEYKSGYIKGEYRLEENRQQQGSGYFKGSFWGRWFISNDGKITYNTLDLVTDGFSNNHFTGSWTSYATGKSKKCNWGDFRIPDSGDLDVGTGEFAVAGKYIKNGWETYVQAANVPDSLEGKRALAIEATRWWE
jgi:hypothetical protein